MKPRVQYIDCGDVTVGRQAEVFTYNHYNQKLRGWITTSKVVKLMPGATGPVFETLNTVYWPYETDESNPYLKKEEVCDHQI